MTNNENIVRIRALFTDDISLRVFDACVQKRNWQQFAFPETLEFTGLDETTKSRLLEIVEEMCNSQREKFIYGAGSGCRAVLDKRGGMKMLNISTWQGIIDNNLTGKRYGLPIVSFAEFTTKYKNALVLNSVGQPAGSGIHKQCIDAGINCVSLFELDMSWDQYFDLPKELGVVGDNEVFVQAGCYNGDTQKSYINWFGDTYAKMVTFEPGIEEITISREKLHGLRDIDIVQAGLSKKSGVTRFDLGPTRGGRSFISETGSEEIKVVALDDYMREQRVTFIALDTEGGELDALCGAEQIIRTQKPKLAISVYHKPEDILEIPKLVKKLNPEYKLYLRHYHLLDMGDTVLYAF